MTDIDEDNITKTTLSDIIASSSEDDVCYHIMAWFDDMFSDGKFAEADRQLSLVDVKSSRTVALICVLTCIAWPPDGLITCGQKFYDQARAEISSRKSEGSIKGLFDGLEWRNGNLVRRRY